MTKSRFRSTPASGAHPKIHTIVILSFLSIFLISSASVFHIKTQAISERVKEVADITGTFYETSSLKRYKILHLATHGLLDNTEYSKRIEALNNNEDQVIVLGAQQFERLKATALEAEAIMAIYTDSSASTTISSPNLELLAERMSLESSRLGGRLSQAEYQSSKSILLEQENLIAMQQVINASATEPSQEDITDIRNQLADLKDAVSKLSNAGNVQYPPAFWVAVAVAACSWLVMFYNFGFSLLKERRERRKDKREEATVLLYSESELQKVVADSHLSTRLKK